MRYFLFIIFLAVSVVSGAQNKPVIYYDDVKLQQWVPHNHSIKGWDWSLPSGARPSQYGFMLTKMGPQKNFPGNKLMRVDLQWKNLEPEEGVYKFDSVKYKIKEAIRQGYKGVAIYIKASVWETKFFKWEDSSILKPKNGGPPNWENAKMLFARTVEGSAPRWLSKYNIPKVEEEMTKNNADPFQIINFDIFHPEYHNRYVKLVNEFGRLGILDMPEVVFFYMNYKSRTHGEEGPGLDPDDQRWPVYKDRMKAWADAAGTKNAGKMTFSGNVGKNLSLALDTFHFGQRNGFVEMYLLHCDNNQLGITLDKKGYMHVDENLPAIKEHRVWGDENEEYPQRWVVRFGPLETFPHRYRESELRALQMRRSFMWESDKTIDPHLTAYVAMSLGHAPETSADAWCYLRESYVKRTTGKESPVKNFERWIIQRDSAGAVTTPVRKVIHGTKGFLRPAMFNTYVEDKQYDFIARKGNKIGFYIDRAFLTQANYALKISHWDNADFTVHYHTSSGYKKFDVKSVGSNALTTTTTFINNISKNTGDNFDVYITSAKGAEISFVRLVKTGT